MVHEPRSYVLKVNVTSEYIESIIKLNIIFIYFTKYYLNYRLVYFFDIEP